MSVWRGVFHTSHRAMSKRLSGTMVPVGDHRVDANASAHVTAPHGGLTEAAACKQHEAAAW